MTNKYNNLRNEYNNMKLSQIVSRDDVPDATWKDFLLNQAHKQGYIEVFKENQSLRDIMRKQAEEHEEEKKTLLEKFNADK